MSPNLRLAGARALVARVVGIAAAQSLYWVAFLWRRALRKTTFVAVTGTHGKTTAKEMLAAILGSRSPTLRTFDNENTGVLLTRNLLRVRPRHRFAVLELGVGAPGEMRRLARLVRPDVALVLTVLRTHVKAFGDRGAHAAEKAILLEELRPRGTAVLNADDPLVAAMAASVRGTVVMSGTSPQCDVWAEGATSAWPERLEFDVRSRDGESCRVRTRLVGRHWCAAATAALAAARAMGVPLAAGAAALGDVEPFRARMQPLLLPSGAVVVRDEYDGSIDTFEAGVRFLADARAERRVAVVSDVSDYGSTMRRKRVAHLGRELARVAEVVVFVGRAAAHGRDAARAAGVAAESARSFVDLREAAEFLRATLRRGDLVYLKGRVSDHMSRLFFAQLGRVACWKTDCDLRIVCDRCPELGTPPTDLAKAVPAPLQRTAEPGPALDAR
ncbi:MAG TPA: Mur ligase family protein [Thermoanaerobaculaceae bacterium]|nr:Mur ligase family protein [Thermoanaerobaculaceae bacterium]